MLAFQREALAALDFTDDKIVAMGDEHWRREHLFVPSYLMAPRHVSTEGCRWLKDRILANVGRGKADLPKRIFISRRNAPMRKLENEYEIETLLGEHHFTTVLCENLSFREQVHIFSNANVVISPHGAGLANVVFMEEGKLIVELLPSKRVKPHFCNLASAMKLRYACVSDASEPEEQEPRDERIPESGFRIPVGRLTCALEALEL